MNDPLQRAPLRRAVRLALLSYAVVLFALWAAALQHMYGNGCLLFQSQGTAAINHCKVHPYTFDPNINFNDLTDYVAKMRPMVPTEQLTTGLPIFNYPAPAAFVYAWILKPAHYILTFSVIVVLGMGVTSGLLARALYRAGGGWSAQLAVWVSVFCLGPFGYVLWRSNLEGVSWILFALAFACLLSEHFLAAAVLLGLGVSIKPFPVLLFALLLSRRKYKETAAGVLVAAVTNVLALKALGPSTRSAYRLLQQGVVLYRDIYILNFRYTEARFQHSILDGLKTYIWHYHYFRISPGDMYMAWAYHRYLVAAPALLFLIAILFWRRPWINQMFACVIAIVTLAPLAAEYTLTLVYLPWAALLLYLVREDGAARARLGYLRLIGLLLPLAMIFAPINYLGIYSGTVKCMTLYLLLVIVWFTPMPSAYAGELAAS